MIQKLRWQFVTMMMMMIMIMLAFIFTSMFISARGQFRQSSLERLRMVIKEEHIAKNPPPTGRSGASTLVISVGKDGSVNILKNQFSDLDDDKIMALLAYAEAQEDDNGFIYDDNIRYLKDVKKDGKIRYAFMDCSIEQSSLRFQIYHSVLIGMVVFFLLFLVIIQISRWVVQPVAKAWEEQRRFVADASHELKTPLTVILSNTNMLLDSQEGSQEKNSTRLYHIKAEAMRMKELIENLLQLARTDSQSERPLHQNIDISLLLQRCILTMEPVFYEAGKGITEEIEDDLIVSGSEMKLRQMMDILLDNAFKYSSPNGATQIALKRLSAKELLLAVSNEGSPIPAEECSKLFERFYRIDQSRGTIAGYGLGLSIAKIIVEECGGKIQASSDGKSRNTFFVRLPCAE
ncbi:MAG: sensor histidine kinase [Lachnospiraceae bacterium]